MRISVCEFLRLQTRTNWYYVNPGHWRSGDGLYDARRKADDEYQLYKQGRPARLLSYFEGEPSNIVRQQATKRVSMRRRR